MTEVKLQRRLLTPFLSKKVPPIPDDADRLVYPHRPNVLSWIFFWWLHPLMNVGYKRTLHAGDMFKLNDSNNVESMTKEFVESFEYYANKERAAHHAEKCKERGETTENTSVSFADDTRDYVISATALAKATYWTFRWQYGAACLCLSLGGAGQATAPLLTRKLIEFVQLRAMGLEDNVGSGVGYAIGASLMVLVVGILMNHTFNFSMHTGARAKAVMTKALLDKSFKLTGHSRHKYPTSKITSMMGTDLNRIDFALGFQPFAVTFIVPLAISIGLLIHNIGAPALVGVGVIFLFLFGVMFAMGRLFEYRRSANKFTDARVSYIKEVLSNLKMIKFYSWETPYEERIAENRNGEMRVIYFIQLVRNLMMSVASCMTIFASLGSFLTVYGTTSSTKDPAAIFSSLSLFNSMSSQVLIVPLAVGASVDAVVAVKRISAFLGAEEVEESADSVLSPEAQAEMDEKNLSIKITDASFEWDQYEGDEEEDEDEEEDKKNKKKSKKTKNTSKESSETSETPDEKNAALDFNDDSLTSKSSNTALEKTIFDALKNIDLEIKKGEFIAITGVIGSGKTSLLNALAGFMRKTAGHTAINGSLVLCGVPWIQNATVKDNILFGNPFEEKKYRDVIYACSLESDLEILPAGDETEIGERGINLSGGQKARISLARAVYAGADTILLDDVLSAVDARVGKHIMNNCMLGLLSERTRILATHQLSLIGQVDRVIFLNGDGTISTGTLEELKATNPGFQHLMLHNTGSKKDDDAKSEIESILDEEASLTEEKQLISQQISKMSSISRKPTKGSILDEEAEHYDYKVNEDKDGRLIYDEERSENRIKFQVIKNYIKYGSGIFKHYSSIVVLIAAVIIAVFCQLFTNTWLSFWTEFKFAHRKDNFYIGIYVLLSVLAFITLTAEFVLVAYMTTEASRILNVKAVQKILRVPMSYLDTTPMGRIINRFTKDTDVLDNEIGNELRLLTFFFSFIIGVLILCVIYLPWFAIAIPPLLFLFVAVSNFYQASAREIKRLEAVQRSLVYNNFSETLSGMDTIKAYKKEKLFVTKNSTFIDGMNECTYITISNQRWLSIHLDIIATLMALVVAFLCVFRVFNISPASVGLLLSYVLQIASSLSMMVRMYTSVENELNSVERLCEYAFDLPQERPHVITETTPRPSWPEHGAIKFEHVSLAYREGLPLVLKNLNIDVKPSEKIGVCGRTGAGKSSIMVALYRLTELAEGRIEIDGVDVSTLGLHSLRSKLSIIPQDPVLFRGTLRKNLDPFGYCTDEQLWECLARSTLIEQEKMAAVKAQSSSSENLHKFHLDREVDDEGSNFSLGERQLISFARALVRESKILILDEATSSVDYETDDRIQKTIFREFEDCTILCIAHRLKTIINYDRILVLDKGEVQEFDTPWALFNQDGSIFQQMCEKSNITKEDFE